MNHMIHSIADKVVNKIVNMFTRFAMLMITKRTLVIIIIMRSSLEFLYFTLEDLA